MEIEFPEFSHAPIDIHSHFNHGSLFDCPQPHLGIYEGHLRPIWHRLCGHVHLRICFTASRMCL